jgi:hypothetical protein
MTTTDTAQKTLSARRYLSSYTDYNRAGVLQAAVDEYLGRRDRRRHPDGTFDRMRRWYPSDEERCGCCDDIRTPSGAHPYSYMVHCRTAEHVASLYGIATDELERAIRRAEDRGGDERPLYLEWLSSRDALQYRFEAKQYTGKTSHKGEV